MNGRTVYLVGAVFRGLGDVAKGWRIGFLRIGPVKAELPAFPRGSAFPLDRDDPSIIKEPLLEPTENEREGYVPNVVYSCGSLVYRGMLILPYAMSDYASRIAIVDLEELLSSTA